MIECATDATELGSIAGRGNLGRECCPPFPDDCRLHRERLDGMDARYGLQQQRIGCRALLVLLDESLSTQLAQHERTADQQEEHKHDKRRQGHAVLQHHDQEYPRQYQVDQARYRRPGDEIAQRFQFPDFRNGVANLLGLEIAQRQMQQMFYHPCPEVCVYPMRGLPQQAGSGDRQQGLEDDQEDHADTQYMQGGQIAMHQDLVDDDLAKQGHGQRKELYRQGCRQDLRQGAAILQ